MGNPGVPQSIEPAKEFESIINQLQNITSEAKDTSNKFYAKICKLSSFELDSDTEKSVAKDGPDGVISALNGLIDNMSFINRRNLEIFQHLNNMI
jgi:hypothetical protein